MSKDKADCLECATGNDNHCRKGATYTYGKILKDGQMTQGGYADYIRVHHKWAIKVPDTIASEHAAPLMVRKNSDKSKQRVTADAHVVSLSVLLS
jgi:D-arabinose 1-dehydrogenase-like Zn-dependent alcohol dehydrogenase